MEEFLVSSFFQYIMFPIGSVVLGVAIKYVTRNDQYSKFTKEDLAVGLELALTAILSLVVLTTNRAASIVQKSRELEAVLDASIVDTSKASVLQSELLEMSRQQTSSFVSITLMFFALWAISTLVRKGGWKSATDMHPVVGITLPLMFGVVAFVVVMAGVNE